jgi:hypothetical protein
VKSAFITACCWVIGKQLTAKDAFDLKEFVGRRYLLTVGQQTDKSGNPKQWRHVVNAMLVPEGR